MENASDESVPLSLVCYAALRIKRSWRIGHGLNQKLPLTTQVRVSMAFGYFAVGWEVYEVESGEKAAALLQRSVMSEKCWRQPLVLHSDNGAPMKSVTRLTKMYDLGITPSRDRPQVSNDNPYSESLIRTLKYCPQWPQEGFPGLGAAYLGEKLHDLVHSRIRFVTPAQRHEGKDREILAHRDAIYGLAREKRPERWSGETRHWIPIGTVYLNPERELTVVVNVA